MPAARREMFGYRANRSAAIRRHLFEAVGGGVPLRSSDYADTFAISRSTVSGSASIIAKKARAGASG